MRLTWTRAGELSRGSTFGQQSQEALCLRGFVPRIFQEVVAFERGQQRRDFMAQYSITGRGLGYKRVARRRIAVESILE